MVNRINFSSILQIWYVEVRISRSISESPLEFEITRVDCIRNLRLYTFAIFVGVFPAGTQHQNDVLSTSMRRDHVASTLIRRHFNVVCPLGLYSIWKPWSTAEVPIYSWIQSLPVTRSGLYRGRDNNCHLEELISPAVDGAVWEGRRTFFMASVGRNFFSFSLSL